MVFGFQGIKGSNAVGTYDQPGLPNITGGFGQNAAITVDGAFKKTSRLSESIAGGGSTTNSIDFDASLSNAIYGASTTVQPPATEMYLYFYVGQYKRDEIYNAACLNKSYVDEKISESKGYAFPDYSNVQTIKASGDAYDENGYSAPDNGWFLVDSVNLKNVTTNIYFYINDIRVGEAHIYISTSSSAQYTVATYPCSKGDKITLTYATNDQRNNMEISFINHRR